MKSYSFAEPHPTGGLAVVTITEEEIVAYMRKMPRYANWHSTDLVDEFTGIHWASEIPEPRDTETDW